MPYCTTCKEEKPNEAFQRRYNGTWRKTCSVCLDLLQPDPKGVAWRKTFNGRFTRLKSKAKDRGLTWELTKEQLQDFWQKPCHYCHTDIDTVGLDRLNSDIGYVYDNLVSCCHICNTMKSDMDQTEFFQHILKIAAHL